MTREQEHERLQKLERDYDQLFDWAMEDKQEWDEKFENLHKHNEEDMAYWKETFDEEMERMEELRDDIQQEQSAMRNHMYKEMEYNHEVYHRGGKGMSPSHIWTAIAGLFVGGGSAYIIQHRRRMFVLRAMERRIDLAADMTKEQRKRMRHTILTEFLANNYYSDKEKDRWRKVLCNLLDEDKNNL